MKNEPINEAFKRIASTELRLDIDIKDAVFLGAFDRLYEENKFKIKEFGTHYVVMAYEVKISQPLDLSEDDQHSDYRWFKISDLLNDKYVHSNIKAFFTESFSIPNDSGLYQALMSHYIHYDRQFWSRTQILLAIQGAALVGGYNLRSSLLGTAIMMGAFFLVLAVWGLIGRDINNSRVNQGIMDKLANKLFTYNGIQRVISLRSDPRKKWLRGRSLVHAVIVILLILDLSLAGLYYIKHPNFFPVETSTQVSELREQVKVLGSKLDLVEKHVVESKKLPDERAVKGNELKERKDLAHD